MVQPFREEGRGIAHPVVGATDPPCRIHWRGMCHCGPVCGGNVATMALLLRRGPRVTAGRQRVSRAPA